jgi:hypothetical protein
LTLLASRCLVAAGSSALLLVGRAKGGLGAAEIATVGSVDWVNQPLKSEIVMDSTLILF